MHLVYLLNTANRPITEADVDTFCSAIARNQRRKGAAQEPYVDHVIEVLANALHEPIRGHR